MARAKSLSLASIGQRWRLGGMAMAKVAEWARNLLAIAGVLMLGYWLGSSSHVQAASYSGSDVEFQLTGVNETSSLLVYQPGTKTVYVYRGATVGGSTLQCSFKYQLGAPGGAIQRMNCPIGSALP
jgi:hypothetical protein